MATTQEILDRLRNALTISDPDWDVSPGTPEYKILESVARELSNTQNQGIISDYHWDIDTKAGKYLDRFIETFGMNRIPARRASGVVTFSRGTPATENILVPTGTQVYRPATSIGPQVNFQTVGSGQILVGQTSTTVPVEAVVAGTSGNVPSGSITSLAQSIPGITSITNPEGMSGGADIESDEQLRIRWRQTALRSVAGTEDAYLNTCLEQDYVTKATVVGSSLFSFEQLQVDSNDEVVSQLTDVKYVYTSTQSIGTNLNTANETLGIHGTDYAFTAGPPATFDVSVGDKWEEGDIVEVSYEYSPECSRNDPANGVVHRVDVFVLGDSSLEVTEQRTFNTGVLFTNTGGIDSMNRTNWQRQDGTNPTNGNILLPLASTPLISIPSSISVGVTTYTINEDYWLVREVNNKYGSVRARDGIEWAVGNAPINGATIVLTYSTNILIRRLQDLIEKIRTVGTDVLVHRARPWRARIALSIVYGSGTFPDSINAEVTSGLSAWLSSKIFGDNIQVADLIDVVKDVTGVDNVRLTRSTEDGTVYGIQKIAEDGTTILSSHTNDVYLSRDELPLLHSVVITPRAQNTFGDA